MKCNVYAANLVLWDLMCWMWRGLLWVVAAEGRGKVIILRSPRSINGLAAALSAWMVQHEVKQNLT